MVDEWVWEEGTDTQREGGKEVVRVEHEVGVWRDCCVGAGARVVVEEVGRWKDDKGGRVWRGN